MRCLKWNISLVILTALVRFFVTAPALGVEEFFLTLATTTSTENTGLLAAIHPDFEKKRGIHVRVVAKGTGASLQLGRDGNADVLLVHARAQEDAFVADGFGVNRHDVMVNDFVLLGPEGDPAGIRGFQDAAVALKKIAEAKQTFVSRGDASGTHVKEQALWKASGLALQEKEIEATEDGKTWKT
jgi:tungstate transport system substrate-binding protein